MRPILYAVLYFDRAQFRWTLRITDSMVGLTPVLEMGVAMQHEGYVCAETFDEVIRKVFSAYRNFRLAEIPVDVTCENPVAKQMIEDLGLPREVFVGQPPQSVQLAIAA